MRIIIKVLMFSRNGNFYEATAFLTEPRGRSEHANPQDFKVSTLATANSSRNTKIPAQTRFLLTRSRWIRQRNPRQKKANRAASSKIKGTLPDGPQLCRRLSRLAFDSPGSIRPHDAPRWRRQRRSRCGRECSHFSR